MQRPTSARGFSILEAVIAIGIMTSAVVVLGGVMATATANNLLARNVSVASVAAVQKIEQLRTIEWDGAALSPTQSLDENMSGWVEFLDSGGVVIGGTTTPPAGTVFIRRWSVAPHAAAVDDARVIEVLVTPIGRRSVGGSTGHVPGEARVVALRTRRP
jgi:hypothetical protein